MRDPCSLKDAQRCEKKREINAKECEETQRNAKKTQRNAKKCEERDENVKCGKVALR
jgi:hypothetical protein